MSPRLGKFLALNGVLGKGFRDPSPDQFFGLAIATVTGESSLFASTVKSPLPKYFRVWAPAARAISIIALSRPIPALPTRPELSRRRREMLVLS